jgi:tetratricopeptide (TPR) repeat protein
MISLVNDLLFIAIGIVFCLLTKNEVVKFLKSFSRKAPVIKKYWYYATGYVIFCLLSYLLVYKFSLNESRQENINILGQALTIVFAIIAGYLAFLQVAENRVDKLVDLATEAMRRMSYNRAIEYYEQALQCDSNNNIDILMNLIEACIINEDYERAEEKLEILKIKATKSREPREWIIYLFLSAIKYLFRQHLDDANEKISDLVTYYLDKKIPFKRVGWSYSEILSSSVFQSTNTVVQQMFLNLTQYIDGGMTSDVRKIFEEGNYSYSATPSATAIQPKK